jgi:hypothetical protein
MSGKSMKLRHFLQQAATAVGAAMAFRTVIPCTVPDLKKR